MRPCVLCIANLHHVQTLRTSSLIVQAVNGARTIMALACAKLDVVRQVLDTLSIQLQPCIEIRHVPDEAEHIGVYATRDIAEGEPLGCIPKESALSVVNSAAADILQSSELRGGLALNFAILYEQHVMGPQSKW